MRELGPANENVDKNYYFKNLSNTWKIRIVELSKSERKLELEKKTLDTILLRPNQALSKLRTNLWGRRKTSQRAYARNRLGIVKRNLEFFGRKKV